MATVITKFKTADGKTFNTEVEANGHEKYLEIKDQIEGFIEASGLQKAQAGLMRKYIPAYVAYAAEAGNAASAEQAA